MAKKSQDGGQANGSDGPSKSQVIRDALGENPGASPKEVAEIVNQRHSLGVTAAYVSVVKSQDKKKNGAGASKGRSRTKAAAARAPRPSAPPADTSDAMDAAIGLIEAAGGLDGARAALDRLERLRGKL